MGSPKYMAPEQILGGEITPRTDIYSLGVMMYEMLAGKVPFDRGASVGTLMAHVNDPLPPLRQINPKLLASATMENIVARSLEKDPNRRFNSMKDLLNALKRVGNEDGVLTETHESMPMARVDLLGAPTPRSPGTPASVPPGDASSPGNTTGPQSTSGAQPILDSGRQMPIFASPSISETLSSPASPTDTDMAAVQTPNRGRTYVWGGVAVAVALAVAVVAVSWGGNTKGASTVDAQAGGNPSTTPSTTPTAPPTTTVAATVAATSAPATSAPSAPLIRQVRVESEPSGAAVAEGDTQLCTSTPCELTWKDEAARADHKLKIDKKGFKTYRVTVGPSEEKVTAKLDVIVVVQQALPPPPPPGPGKSVYKKDNPY
jgi:serine/threonine-protein kinase